MTYLLEIKETPEAKHLLEHLKTLKYVKVKKLTAEKPQKKYRFTDEEMALPGGKKPNKQELEEWLTQPDKDNGAPAETVRKRLLKRLRSGVTSKK